MKLLRLALLASAATFVCLSLRAQDSDDEEKSKKPPIEIPDFNNLDEYVYVPKSTVNVGYRYISGIKACFSGNGTVAAPEAIPSGAADVSRTYHDGVVSPDSRTLTYDNGNGSSVSLPGPNDGKTDTWSDTAQTQITPDGFLSMDIYSAQTATTNSLDKVGRNTVGLELTVTHDMQKFGKHLEWKLFGGMSISDIDAASFATVRSNIITYSDIYDLYGQVPPGAPFSSPSGATVPYTILISNLPLANEVTSSADSISVTNHYKLHGADTTFRGGPQFIFNYNDHLKLIASIGPAILVAGSTYDVDEVLTPPNGLQIVNAYENTTNRILFGYYADLTLQYDITDRAGFYFGAFDQSAGSYVQSVNTAGQGTAFSENVPNYPGPGFSGGQGPAYYSAHVDFSDQNGFRAGMDFKF
jgi:hypothetical protein